FAIVKSSGRDPGAVAPLVALAEALAMPVFDQAATHLNFPQDHPLYGGGDPTAYLSDADPIVVVEADAPWFPALRAPRPETTVIQIGHDPLFSRYPIRGFAVDLGLAGAPRLTLAALAAAVQRRGGDARGPTSASRRPPGSAGGSAPRWAPSWPRPTRRSSAASATAPTSSAPRRPPTGRRGRTTSPC